MWMKNHSLLNFSAFICAFVIGFMFSARFYDPGSTFIPFTSNVSAAETQHGIRELGNGQKSFLVITTSAIVKPEAELTGIWLVSYMPNKPDIHILPIYPTAGTDTTGLDQQLAASFQLSTLGKTSLVDQTFLDLMTSKNYWWSGYIVLDEQALGALTPGVENIMTADPSAPSLLQSACTLLVKDGIANELTQLFNSDNPRIISDLDPEVLQQEVQNLLSDEQPLTCTFPAIAVSASAH
jgi:hypothetical protein